MELEGKVGQQGPFAAGAKVVARMGSLTELIMSELQARYGEQTMRRNVFSAYFSAQATSLVGAAMVGGQLSNNSQNIALVLLKTAGNIIVTSATATSIVLAAGVGQAQAPTGQTAASRVGNDYIGGPNPAGLATNAATFTNAPVAMWPLLHNTAAIGSTGNDPGWQMDFEGSIIIPPQCYVAFAAVGGAVAAAGMNAALKWMEVPIPN